MELTMSDWVPVFVAIIAAIPGFAALVISARKERAVAQKEEGDAASRLSEAALKLIEPYQLEVKRLSDKVTHLEAQLDKYRKENARLEKEVAELRHQLNI